MTADQVAEHLRTHWPKLAASVFEYAYRLFLLPLPTGTPKTSHKPMEGTPKTFSSSLVQPDNLLPPQIQREWRHFCPADQLGIRPPIPIGHNLERDKAVGALAAVASHPRRLLAAAAFPRKIHLAIHI